MGIKGLTDQYKTKMDTRPNGKPVRIGFLQKGKREGFGKKIRLTDLDHFRFKPVATDEARARRMIQLFQDAYGKEPRAINDVRIPVAVAGNFSIEETASMVAMKHTKSGSIFMAEGDRETITKRRDPETGKVLIAPRDGGPWPWEAFTQERGDYGPHFVYGDKFYPWSGSMAIDLLLPALNERLHEEGLAGAGVVTFITHSNNDIPNLIGEYYQALEELASLYANPLDPKSAERQRDYIPLRNVPLRLYRSEDTVSTPNYHKDADAGDRLVSTRWLCHWQLAPQFAQAIHEAMDQRTQKLIAYIGTDQHLLAARQGIKQINADLYGDNGDDELPALPASVEEEPGPAAEIVDWEELAEEEAEAEWEEVSATEAEEAPAVEAGDDPFGARPGNLDVEVPDSPDYWRMQALKATTLDGLASALYQLHRPAGIFEDANHARRGYAYMCGEYPADRPLAERYRDNATALKAFAKYANAVADGVDLRDAADAGQAAFVQELAKVAVGDVVIDEEE